MSVSFISFKASPQGTSGHLKLVLLLKTIKLSFPSYIESRNFNFSVISRCDTYYLNCCHNNNNNI